MKSCVWRVRGKSGYHHLGRTPRKNDEPPSHLTPQDLVLGRKTSRYLDLLCLVAIAVCAAIAVFVAFSVPLGRRMPYSGQFSRSGIPWPVAMGATLFVLFGLWRSGKKPDAHHMGKKARFGVYTLGSVMVAGCVIGQWVMARSILIEGGAF